MLRRHLAREVVLQVLYQDDLNPGLNPRIADEFIARRLRWPDLAAFARSLVAGVRAHRPQIDELLGQTADNWSLRRMAATDRNVLRLGAYEILHSDTPPRVAINEAVELAKRFGTGQSPQFVNGILDRFLALRRDRPEDERPEDERAEDERAEDERPRDERPTDERPTDERPTDERGA